ncbi:MAG: acylphosphatase [Candidatus Altiarchaeota archaeon]
MALRARIIVSGRVQGVYFRAHAKDEALKLNLRGWVRNLPDRMVEAVIEGDDKSVKKMVDWCRTGPPSARVESIEVEWEKPSDEFSSFTVRY